MIPFLMFSVSYRGNLSMSVRFSQARISSSLFVASPISFRKCMKDCRVISEFSLRLNI